MNQLAIDAARINLAEVEECLFWIPRHEATLAEGRERPAYLEQVRKQLAYRYRRYLDYVRLYTLHCEQAGIVGFADA